ncbi:hypothetical protein GCM10008090_23210 [Arenicella chitinivorans]|uniref:Lipoprotein n=1 Tax=Arenicella chitinivorans TaxID=1329800 RepID=A0A918VMD9_9GAMM|nr:hypothetical protein [Arenicella chitinivorans]GHA12887.1 hypothetical protein GCM10008090_23210 [Arenicella chitinivorans]
MKKHHALFTLVLSLHGVGVAHAGDACDKSSPEQMAAHFGVAADQVQEEMLYQRRATSHCSWRVAEQDGVSVSVSYRINGQPKNVTDPDFFNKRLAQMISDGHEVGNKTLSYTAQSLGGKQGALSEDKSTYTTEMSFVWITDNGTMDAVSLAYTGAPGSKAPTSETLGELVSKLAN